MNNMPNSKPQVDFQALFQTLYQRAQKGEHEQFKLIKTYADYKWQKRRIPAGKVVVKKFTDMYKKAVKICLGEIKQGKVSPQDIYTTAGLGRAVEFYKKELEIVRDKIYEYKCYLDAGEGHWWNAYVECLERPERDLHDFRITGLEDFFDAGK